MAKTYYQPNGCSVGGCNEETTTCEAGAETLSAQRLLIIAPLHTHATDGALPCAKNCPTSSFQCVEWLDDILPLGLDLPP